MRSGFSIIKNGEKLGFPYLESLRSLAPLVDELVVAVGDSNDGTREALEKLKTELPCELRLFDSPWDPTPRADGGELARQSNLALDACRHDICFYLQGDEVLHEAEHTLLREDLERFAHDANAQALALHWRHFYGNFDTVVHNRRWYRREVRVIKKSSGARSFRDAQGFRIPLGGGWHKPVAALSRAHVHHYGWVRPPRVMAEKSEKMDQLWHGSARDGRHTESNVYPVQYGLRPYSGTHPRVMLARVQALQGYDPFARQRMKHDHEWLRLASADWVERLCGWRIGEHTHFKLYSKY